MVGDENHSTCFVHLSDKQITKFQELYKAQFGEVVDRRTALELATKLVEMMHAILRSDSSRSDELKTEDTKHS